MCGVGLSLTTSDSIYISINEVAFSRRMIRIFTRNPYNRPSPTGYISCNQYLRTVIVTADIDGGLYHPALAHRRYLTFPHWSGVTSYTSTYVFAGSCVFGKQSLGKLSLRPPSLYFQSNESLREKFLSNYFYLRSCNYEFRRGGKVI